MTHINHTQPTTVPTFWLVCAGSQRFLWFWATCPEVENSTLGHSPYHTSYVPTNN